MCGHSCVRLLRTPAIPNLIANSDTVYSIQVGEEKNGTWIDLQTGKIPLDFVFLFVIDIPVLSKSIFSSFVIPFLFKNNWCNYGIPFYLIYMFIQAPNTESLIFFPIEKLLLLKISRIQNINTWFFQIVPRRKMIFVYLSWINYYVVPFYTIFNQTWDPILNQT